MAKKLFLAAILFIGMLTETKADLIEEGQIPRQFMFLNLSKYKGFSFSFQYQTYHYDHGYQPYPPVDSAVKDNERYDAGTRFDMTRLHAKDANGKEYVSDIEIGGDTRVTNRDILSVVDVYTIESINKDVIKLNKAYEIVVYAGGKEKKRKSELESSLSEDNGGNITPWLIGGALAAIAGLVLIFLKNRKKQIMPAV
jgi:hypothetical protein